MHVCERQCIERQRIVSRRWMLPTTWSREKVAEIRGEERRSISQSERWDIHPSTSAVIFIFTRVVVVVITITIWRGWRCSCIGGSIRVLAATAHNSDHKSRTTIWAKPPITTARTIFPFSSYPYSWLSTIPFDHSLAMSQSWPGRSNLINFEMTSLSPLTTTVYSTTSRSVSRSMHCNVCMIIMTTVGLGQGACCRWIKRRLHVRSSLQRMKLHRFWCPELQKCTVKKKSPPQVLMPASIRLGGVEWGSNANRRKVFASLQQPALGWLPHSEGDL